MLNTKMTCKVKNRSNGKVAYTVQYNGNKIHQCYNPGEIKFIPYEELRQLSYQHGGLDLIYNYLQISNEGKRVLNSFNLNPEPEYFLSEDDIKELLNNGDMNEFLDCLDFAPIGVLDLIKKYSVELPLNDYNKRQAIKKVLGFDVDGAIKNNELSKEENKASEQPATRRTAATEEKKSEAPARRVIKKKE